MKLQWLGHACFRVEADNGYAIVLDPYADGKVPGLRLRNPTANDVLCSHGHGDHNAAHMVRLQNAKVPSPFTVARIATFHDEAGGALRGPNTVHVLEADGIRAAHLGDLGHQLTPGQIKLIGRLDVLMVPIGGHYTIDAHGARAVTDALCPTVVLPMHYRSASFGFPVIGTLDTYLSLCGDVVQYDGDTMDIMPGMPRQTAVLQYL